MSTEPTPLLLGSSLATGIYLFMVANPGTMRNVKVPANALTAALRANIINPRSGQGLEYCPLRLRQMAKGEGEWSIAPFAGDTFASRTVHPPRHRQGHQAPRTAYPPAGKESAR